MVSALVSKYFISSDSIIIIRLCGWRVVHVNAVLIEAKEGVRYPGVKVPNMGAGN